MQNQQPKQIISHQEFAGACDLLRKAHELAGTNPSDRTVSQYRAVLDAVGELIRQDLGVQTVRVSATAKLDNVQMAM